MPLILRLEKGSPLTYQEMDANLTYLFSASINDTGSEIFSGSLTVTGSLKVTGSTAVNGTWVLTGSAITSGSLKVLGNINNSGSIYITTDTLTQFVPSIDITSSVDGFNTLELYNNANQGYSATALTLKNNLLDKSHIIVPGEYYGYGWFDNDSITGSLVLHSNKDVVFIASGSTFPKSGEETLRIQKNRVIISGSLTVTGTTSNQIIGTTQVTGSFEVSGSVVLAPNTANTVLIGNGNFGFTNVLFYTAGNSNGFSITRITATTTAPCYIINRADTTTGIGGNIGTVGLIVSGSSVLTVSSSYVGATGSIQLSGSLSVNPSGSFTLPTTASFITPQTGSMFFSGSYIWVHNGVRWMSASLA